MKKTIAPTPPRWLRYFALLTLLAASVSVACQVPVFRYALERWPADQYEIVVLHQGPLSAADRERLGSLRDLDHRSPVSANLSVVSLDIKEQKDKMLRELWKKHNDQAKPVMVVLYPRNAQEVPDRVADVSPLTDETIARLADSPVRREITKRLVDGDSAVWIFVESGQKEKDSAALKRLTEHVRQSEKELELPPQEEIEADEFFNEESKVDLRLAFSIVSVRRDDPQEQFLLKMLLGSEPDLESLDEPMAFPVLGRGRVLYGLVGKGIYRDTIAMASSFIVGPCSCQVKEQNPGFDLLLAVDWDEKIGVTALSEPPPPKSTKPILINIPPGNKSR